ncbi:hypothetical protein [Streptomyces sp. GbtcB6]|uniref:hypothetical protein n=1 Tax=Streptomyces sp. GbtcB6 TaxID=2824751 RepID=UPI0020C5EAC1|nr:hypothetical protein [Streptomyces sp. GbtcB6]
MTPNLADRLFTVVQASMMNKDEQLDGRKGERGDAWEQIMSGIQRHWPSCGPGCEPGASRGV